MRLSLSLSPSFTIPSFYRFFAAILTYFIAGALIMKFRKGASGKEVIPNYEFWFALPFYVKVRMDTQTYTYTTCGALSHTHALHVTYTCITCEVL